MSYLGEDIKKLGFGLMRLPRTASDEIDVAQTCKMVDMFLDAGFTYFDTAWAYRAARTRYAARWWSVTRVTDTCSRPRTPRG